MTRPLTFLLALSGFALLGAVPSYAQTDQSLLTAALREQDAVIRSLQEMVAIESGSDDVAGLSRIATYLEDRLKKLGAQTQRIASTNGQPPGLVKGEFKGTGKLRIMLIAHMDTVYQQGILQREPYRRDGNKIYGPGIADDKGGIAVILHAVAILQKAGWTDFDRLTVVFNPDEEVGSPGSGSIIAELASGNDVVLSYEPSPAKSIAGSEGVLLRAAGTAAITLTIHGRAAHAGAAPDEGRNALLELAHQLLQTRDLANDIPGVQMHWTTATAGSVRNQIPEFAEAGSDVRVTEMGATEKLLAAVKAKVAQNPLIPDTRAEVVLRVMRPMFVAGTRGEGLAELAQSIYRELHEGELSRELSRDMPAEGDGRSLLLIPGTTGGTDAGFAASSGKAAVLEGLGLAGWDYHYKGEYIEVDSIVPRLYLSTRMLVELGRKASSSQTF